MRRYLMERRRWGTRESEPGRCSFDVGVLVWERAGLAGSGHEGGGEGPVAVRHASILSGIDRREDGGERYGKAAGELK